MSSNSSDNSSNNNANSTENSVTKGTLEKSKDTKRCEQRLEFTIAKNKNVHRLLEAIEGLGCKLPTDFFACRKCDADISGGFTVGDLANKDYKPQVITCENRPMEIETFEHTVVHELVHAYDTCRAKIDYRNCEHHACAEIRASSLSGECSFLHELWRGHFLITNGNQACVKRRATLSLAMNPYCKDNAAEIVEKVFDKCYKDKEPFQDKL